MTWSICSCSKFRPKPPAGGPSAEALIGAFAAVGELDFSVTPSRPISKCPILNTFPDSESWCDGDDGETPVEELGLTPSTPETASGANERLLLLRPSELPTTMRSQQESPERALSWMVGWRRSLPLVTVGYHNT